MGWNQIQNQDKSWVESKENQPIMGIAQTIPRYISLA